MIWFLQTTVVIFMFLINGCGNATDPNHAPVAESQSITIDEDTSKTIVLKGSDPDGDPVNFTIVEGPLHGILNGTAARPIYTPNANYAGTDKFVFQVDDGYKSSTPATVEIEIKPINDIPVANAQDIVLDEDRSKSIVLTGDDPDGDTLVYTIVSPPQHGILQGTAPNLTYIPNENYHGMDNFTFKVNDGQVDSSIAKVIIAVDFVNHAPVAESQSITIDEDTSKTIVLKGSDPDGDPVNFTIVEGPLHGILNGTAARPIYTPNANYAGTDKFVFQVDDGYKSSTPATVEIEIKPINDIPVANAQDIVLNEDRSKSIVLTGEDPDGDTLVYTIVSPPQHGILQGTAPNLTYIPNENYHGMDNFTFKVNDGQVDSDPVKVNIKITPVNDIPIADAGLPQTVNEGENVQLDGTASSDIDGDTLRYSWHFIKKPSGSNAVLDNNAVARPNFLPDQVGEYIVALIVNDGKVDSSPANVTITVLKVCHSVLQTGQTTVYYENDDGDYVKGRARDYTRNDEKKVVKDNVTGLMWQDDGYVSVVTKKWLTYENYAAKNYTDTTGDTAETYCKNLTLGSYTDWRLPTIEELISLTRKDRAYPAIDLIFQNGTSYSYWSSTTDVSDSGRAWSVSFDIGNSTKYSKDESNYIRCVRKFK